VGIDNINDYYDVKLKYLRLKVSGIDKNKISYGSKVPSTTFSQYVFIKLDLNDREKILQLFAEEQFDCVCNLAAQAGVRYSIDNPYSYIDSNINGFINILESCRHQKIKHLVYASSSSVYGLNEKTPFSVTDKTDNPISLYAATKKSNELMAFTYSHLYNIPCTGLRFFTVYGPWGRPDMAYYKFVNAILENKHIEVFNNGELQRDFTYIDDIIEGVLSAIEHIPSGHIVYNLGNNRPEKLMFFIETLENILDKKAEKIFLGMQAGDVLTTFSDIEETRKNLSWQPKTSIEVGLKLFADWYIEYQNCI
jgi:UDP-glucuronate 4-epimerase